ncbi:hypothetical protein DPMN_152658 [Dreissena polymorpha]|uniref:Uncharacterized protein n=1 Tax=Dreissena polymorpha TaxID=45954 RepID=A0A9D4J5D1_DREPO|nr:hypothetical protein DPMN_152658 [Dreissena polymorpha]
MTELLPNISCYHNKCDNVTTIVTESNLKFLSKTTDAIFETLKALAESDDCKSAHAGKRSIRDLSELESTYICPVNFNTTPKPKTNGCHPVIP